MEKEPNTAKTDCQDKESKSSQGGKEATSEEKGKTGTRYHLTLK